MDSATARKDRRSGEQAATIAAALREDIIAGHLAAGAPLRQERLAARFSTSRMPVREALRLLESEGLVALQPNKGAIVAALDTEELREIYEMRVAAETLALRLAIPELSNAQIARAEAIQAQAEASSLRDFGELNKAFHATLYQPCDRPRLLAHIASLNGLADRYLRLTVKRLDYAERSHREHRALLEACRRRDESEAVAILRRHVGEAGEALYRLLTSDTIEGAVLGDRTVQIKPPPRA